jgi:hypothetical protein
MDELRLILSDLDKGKPPLPKDLLWCMAMGDKVTSTHLLRECMN